MNPGNQIESEIIYFDGICVVCNSFVDFILKHDSHQKYLFASLQGLHAQKNLNSHLINPPQSIVLRKYGDALTHSDAVLQILIGLEGWWKMAWLAYIFPKFIRDLAYVSFARIRYQVFGKKDVCRLPTPSEKNRFLE